MKSPYQLKRLTLLALAFLVTSCSLEAEPIRYGHDQCDYCKMTVVEKHFASQGVTQKGKQFKYDSIECMVRAVNNELPEKDMAKLLVPNYTDAAMTPASEATYLVSRKIKSPMGEYLSAYKTAEAARAKQKEVGGELYTWKTLKEYLSE